MLAALRAGRAFFVITPDLPDARIAALLRQVQPPCAVVEPRLRRRFAALLKTAGYAAGVVTGPERSAGESARCDGPTRPIARWDLDGFRSVFFASGSTGSPKGIAGRTQGDRSLRSMGAADVRHRTWRAGESAHRADVRRVPAGCVRAAVRRRDRVGSTGCGRAARRRPSPRVASIRPPESHPDPALAVSSHAPAPPRPLPPPPLRLPLS